MLVNSIVNSLLAIPGHQVCLETNKTKFTANILVISMLVPMLREEIQWTIPFHQAALLS